MSYQQFAGAMKTRVGRSRSMPMYRDESLEHQRIRRAKELAQQNKIYEKWWKEK